MTDLATDAKALAPAGRPTPVAPAGGPRASHLGYQRAYRLDGRAASCLLQRVRVHIRYRTSGVLMADYRQTYYECFVFDRPDATLVDTHDFDLMRDGWRQSVIAGLVQKHLTRMGTGSGEAALEVHKAFTLAPGEVEDASLTEVADGAQFGLLDAGPDGPSRTTLVLASEDRTTHTITTLPTCPAGYPIAGTGQFAAVRSWRTSERFRHRFANLAGTLDDRGHYRAMRLPRRLLPHRTR